MRTFIIVLVIIFMSGCTMYDIKKEINPVTGVTMTDVKIRSTRDIEQPDVSYSRVGTDATFDFKAAGVDNNTEMFQGMMGMMLEMMKAQMLMAQPEK